jgi:hypothetical protein
MKRGYEQAMLVPLTLFNQCNFEKQSEKTKSETILNDSTLPSDIKIKLFDQEKRLSMDGKAKDKLIKNKIPQNYAEILSYTDSANKPFIKSILDKIEEHASEIFWNASLEVTIEGKFYPESSIIEIFRFLMKKSVITKDSDIPIAGREMRQKLLAIGVPQSWLKVNFQRTSSRRKGKEEKQTGSGYNFLTDKKKTKINKKLWLTL